MDVAGKLNRQAETRDVWRERCDALADEIHFRADDLYEWFGQIWMARVDEGGWPKSVAKWQAFRDLYALDRRGAEPN